jgi:precorrin-3B synthase
MTQAVLRRGWCPGALRPMPTGDGLLARIRLRGGALSPVLARLLAEGAKRYGNGLIDLTSRANLQIRGLSEPSHAELLTHLAGADILDEDPAAEAVRNILVSPLAGSNDFGALVDIAPIARALEQRLAADTRLHGLPAKFSFVLDDGGWPSLADIKADVRFEACRTADGHVFRVTFGGTSASAMPLGFCTQENVEGVAACIARAVLTTDNDVPPRDRLRQCAGLTELAGNVLPPLRKDERPPIGLFPGAEGRSFLGLGFAFGRISAESLGCLADAADDLGCDALRVTPWRALLLPLDRPAALPHWLKRFAAQGFILDATDPRLAVAACPGAPACKSATTSTQDDALQLAPLARQLAQEGIRLHVSGCTKGCAFSQNAPVTLVASNGLYGLVLDGKAQDPILEPPLSLKAMETRLQHLSGAL